MSRAIFCSLFLAQQFLAGVASAAVLHAIILADTYSHTGYSAATSLVEVRGEVARIGEHTGLEVRQQVFEGGSCRGAVLKALEVLQPAPDDRVLFYYLGHGYRKSYMRTPWPLIYFSEEENSLDVQLILESIIAKKPYFALLVADCCNNVMDGIVTIGLHPLGRRSVASGYRKLFLESQGVIAAVAAKAEDYAYCDDQGHCFSRAFWDALHLEAQTFEPSWTRLLKRTTQFLQAIQEPYWEILVYP